MDAAYCGLVVMIHAISVGSEAILLVVVRVAGDFGDGTDGLNTVVGLSLLERLRVRLLEVIV